MVSKAETLEHIEVNSELEALLLESRLIKKFKPFYNLISKDDKSPYYIHITHEDFPKPVINHIEKYSIAGPFLNRYLPTRVLRHFRTIAPYCLSPRPVKRACLYSHMGLCSPCPGDLNISEKRDLYNQNIIRLKRLLKGQFSAVKRNLVFQMRKQSQLEHYEQAGILKGQILALDLLSTITVSPDAYISNPNLTQDLRDEALESISKLLNIKKPLRIEMYDNAHLSGTAATSAMTVAQNGELIPSLYRHFTINNSPSGSDVGMMVEVLSRRFKNLDWPKPDLVVLDGGKPQLSAVTKLNIGVPLISLAKNQEIILVPKEHGYAEIILPKNDRGLHLLQNLRDEAHRFSRRLHHKHRAKIT